MLWQLTQAGIKNSYYIWQPAKNPFLHTLVAMAQTYQLNNYTIVHCIRLEPKENLSLPPNLEGTEFCLVCVKHLCCRRDTYLTPLQWPAHSLFPCSHLWCWQGPLIEGAFPPCSASVHTLVGHCQCGHRSSLNCHTHILRGVCSFVVVCVCVRAQHHWTFYVIPCNIRGKSSDT